MRASTLRGQLGLAPRDVLEPIGLQHRRRDALLGDNALGRRLQLGERRRIGQGAAVLGLEAQDGEHLEQREHPRQRLGPDLLALPRVRERRRQRDVVLMPLDRDLGRLAVGRSIRRVGALTVRVSREDESASAGGKEPCSSGRAGHLDAHRVVVRDEIAEDVAGQAETRRAVELDARFSAKRIDARLSRVSARPMTLSQSE